MRWVLLGRFGETTRQCAAFILGRQDAIAAILEPRARLRPAWDEARFREAVRQWADRHFPEARPLLGVQYPLGPGLFETEWLLYCPICDDGPFHLPGRPGEEGLEPRTWDDSRILHLLATRFGHLHPRPDPPTPTSLGSGRASGVPPSPAPSRPGAGESGAPSAPRTDEPASAPKPPPGPEVLTGRVCGGATRIGA
ncbi:hypothetical protein [Thermaerobacter litoralis]